MSVPLCLRRAGRAVLQPSDLAYLGMFKMPSSGIFPNELSFSAGLISGRRTSGQTTLLITGPEMGSGLPGPDVAELIIPPDNALTSSLATAPHAAKVRGWSGIYAGHHWLPHQPPHPSMATPLFTGIHYAGNDFGLGTQLFWTYSSSYGNPGEFPNIGTTILHDDGTFASYGPWGTGDWEKMTGSMMSIPTSVQAATGCGPLGVCAAPRGGQAGSPWGANLQTFAPPAIGAPDPGNGPYTVQTKAAILHTRDHPQARNTNFRICGSQSANAPYVPAIQACEDGQYIRLPTPTFGGYTDEQRTVGTTVDWVDSGVWIDGPSKQGVFFVGQLSETISIANGFSENRNYGPVDPDNCHQRYGSRTCCHGHVSPTNQSVGPCADSMINYGWIYDPADLIAILNGHKAIYGAVPSSTFHLSTLGAGITVERSYIYQSVGMWFDAAAKRLYIADSRRYMDGYDPLPVVHVLAVDC